ncbi:MAG: right-handed parallel beta-helix repeat-containing protein [Actinobacteria bacterium]|nr:right-handed parallel beta-helix repeat-containing protein [Actinomycetota bacterium]
MSATAASLLRRSLVGALVAAGAVAFSAGHATADVTCTRVAAPNGSDSGAGTADDPYASVQQLVDSLQPGDTGCLRAGTYSEDVTINSGGSGDGSRVTLTSYPGERATVDGRLYVTDAANYVTVENLNLNGRDAPTCASGTTCERLPSPTVNGDYVIFSGDDVTNDHVAICFDLGNASYGRAEHDVIENNRIHDCGRIPSSNHDHGIYLTAADDTTVTGNVIYNNADRGIQLYPDAQRTTIEGNIIDGNGEGVIFSGAGGTVSSNNIVEHNIISNARLRYNVESYFPDGVGSGNVVRDNCLYGGAEGDVVPGQLGFSATNNLVADPDYADAAAGDYSVGNDRCAQVLAGKSPPTNPIADSGSQQGGAGAGTSAAGGLPVQLSHVFLRHGRHHRHWRLQLRGHFSTRGLHTSIVEVRHGGHWDRLAVRHLGRRFRISVDTRTVGFHGATATVVRIVAPSVGRSRAVLARLIG